MSKPRAPLFPPRRTKGPKPEAKPRMPWQLPRDIEDADVFALQALAAGNANPAQQQRALALFRDKLCETDRMSFYPGGDDGRRASDFAEGKRWPGLQVRRILKMRPDHKDQAPAGETEPT